eukprot:jgi/Ulvmu1/3362/UM156_0019.1
MTPPASSTRTMQTRSSSNGSALTSGRYLRGIRTLPRQRLHAGSGRRPKDSCDQFVPKGHKHGPPPNNSMAPFRSTAGEQLVVAAALDVDPSPFFVPMIRCFLLGVAFGGLFEAFSVLSQMADLSTHTANVWKTMAEYSPQFVEDHVLAVGLWLLFYLAECCGHEAAARAGRSSLPRRMALLPKLLVPLDFKVVERAWLDNPYFKNSAGSQVRAATALHAPPKSDGQMSPEIKGVVPVAGRTPHTRGSIVDMPFVADRPDREGLKPGQWDPAQNPFVQTDIARRGLLKNMYYCLGLVPKEGLKSSVVHEAEAMGTRIAYWFDEAGEVHALSSTCTHRGAQLSKGWVDNVNGKSCVRCPYHAWAFSGNGKVQDIPVQTDGRFPKRALQQSFEMQVHGDLLWLFWGSQQLPCEDRPPIPGMAREASALTSSISKVCDVPHQTVYQGLASESAIFTFARVFLGISDSCLYEVGGVESSNAYSRTQKFLMLPTTQGVCPLLPQGSSVPAVMVSVTAYLPSSVAITLDLDHGRLITVEGHVHPQSYETSRLSMSVHRTFAKWPGAGLMVRENLVMLAEAMRGSAEGVPFSSDVLSFTKSCSDEPLLSSIYKLKEEFGKVGLMLPPEIAVVRHRSDV